eukprot:12950749-Alexandrium_andersonii.AAC.1
MCIRDSLFTPPSNAISGVLGFGGFVTCCSCRPDCSDDFWRQSVKFLVGLRDGLPHGWEEQLFSGGLALKRAPLSLSCSPNWRSHVPGVVRA